MNVAIVPDPMKDAVRRLIADHNDIREALHLLLSEAKSGQHRRDRQNRECPPMESAIELAEGVLARTHERPAA